MVFVVEMKKRSHIRNLKKMSLVEKCLESDERVFPKETVVNVCFTRVVLQDVKEKRKALFEISSPSRVFPIVSFNFPSL